MRFRELISKHWQDIRGNAKWDFTKWIFWILLGAVGAAGLWAVRMLTNLLRGLSVSDQSTVLSILVIAWVVCIAAVVWAFKASAAGAARRRNEDIAFAKAIAEDLALVLIAEAQTNTTDAELQSPAPAPMLTAPPSPEPAQLIPPEPFTPRAVPDFIRAAVDEYTAQLPAPHVEQGDVKLIIEIHEVLFLQLSTIPLMALPKHLILFNLSVTNHGHDEPTARAWNLTVRIGKEKKDTDTVMVLPGRWAISRKGPEFNTTHDELPTPDVAAVSRVDEFKYAKPKTGWVAFEMNADFDAVPPYHAAFAITITDSLGNTFVGIQEPMWYVEKGIIHAV